jgi:hypothetical protein
MKIYMDPKETAIVNLEEVKEVLKSGTRSLTVWFKEGGFRSFDFADKEQRDNELRIIFHEMHD